MAQSQAIILAEYRGLGVGALTELRKQARAQGVYLRVLKNTLARRAVVGTSFEGLAEKMVGPLMYGMSSDPVSAAKVLSAFAKGNDKLVLGRATNQFTIGNDIETIIGLDFSDRVTFSAAITSGH